MFLYLFHGYLWGLVDIFYPNIYMYKSKLYIYYVWRYMYVCGGILYRYFNLSIDQA